MKKLVLFVIKYEILLLDKGSGGCSEVYLANQKIDNRPTAIKIIKIKDEDEKKNALNEASAMKKLKHRNILKIYDH